MIDPRIDDLAKKIKILERKINAIVEHLSPDLEGSYLEQQMEEIEKEILGEE